LICAGKSYTYGELDRRANQLARYLVSIGIRPGDRIGIVLERSLYTYVAVLGILKAGAAFVPMDPGFPEKRLAYISRDAGLMAILTTSSCRGPLSGVTCPLVLLDQDEQIIAKQRMGRLARNMVGQTDADPLCYIIYTSGSTGNPKGVAIEHGSICNFVQVAADVYDIRPDDRVYQGMTIAFDFSIEEIWPAWITGAVVVAGPLDERRMGSGLAGFLRAHRITVFCCVPTLLATLDQDIPTLRTLIVGGEPCPQALVERWARPPVRMLNTYGPTETTVTATWGELYPGKPVTIGRAMPTYTVYILDEHGRPVDNGEPGEICIGGIGLARGYVNQPEKTAQAFIPDTLDTPDNPSGRIYRTGDLGRLRDDGEIEYLGRIDTQVKIRGYRIELTEIESVILESDEVRKVVVSPWQDDQGNTELAAWCELAPGYAQIDQSVLRSRLRGRLPAYMMPAYVEVVDRIPLLANGKTDRNSLPAPRGPRFGAEGNGDGFVAPQGALEEKIAAEMAGLLGVDRVSVEDDFFLDLGAHSLLVARLVSILREDAAMAGLGLSDMYRYPTIRSLAAFIASEQGPARDTAVSDSPDGKGFVQAGERRVWFCGLVQLAGLFLIGAVSLLPLLWGQARFLAGGFAGLNGFAAVACMSAVVLMLSLFLGFAVPVLLKWLLLPRVRPGSYPLWGWFFIRFWIVDKALAMAPLPLLSGTPLLSVYYRLLGARLGRDVLFASPLVHLPELLSVGDGSRMNTGSHIFCYQIENGQIRVSPVSIGAHCVIGANSVILPGARMGSRARLGDQSLLAMRCTIPAGEWWSGSPARPGPREHVQEDEVRDEAVLPAPVQWAWFLLAVPLLALLPLVASLPGIGLLLGAYRFQGSLAALVVAPVAGLLFVVLLCVLLLCGKRLVLARIEPGTYRIGSFWYLRKWFVDRLMEMSLLMTNSLYATLYLAPFLRGMGARIGRLAEVSTISYVTPDLLDIGDESFVADIAHIGPMVMEGNCCTLAPVRIDRRSFVGNAAFVPGGTSIGENSLIGVLSVPPASSVPAESIWLGSPPLHLPEREQSESFPEHLTFAPTRKLFSARLLYEYFRVTLPATLLFVGGVLLVRFGAILIASHSLAVAALALAPVAFGIAFLLTLLVAGLKKLLIGTYRPRVRPMWSSFVWRSELVTALYENVAVPMLLARLTATPFLAPVLRLFGARIGRRCCIETTFLTEFDLVEVGNDCCIGQACSLQTHLFEDRVMKMSRLRIGNRCSIGPRAVVLYDALLEDDVCLDGLSLVMKGETLGQGTCWRGSPAATV
jgi:non-ribosomal peptide synthetase-like protein